MKMKKNKIYTGWLVSECGQLVRATTTATAPNMARYLANFKARRAAR